MRTRYYDEIAQEHARADGACGRAWVCACGACRTIRAVAPTFTRAFVALNRRERAKRRRRSA